MTFNSCNHCGSIKETATIRLNKLKKKLEDRQYILKYGEAEDKMAHYVGEDDLWEWSKAIEKALEDL